MHPLLKSMRAADHNWIRSVATCTRSSSSRSLAFDDGTPNSLIERVRLLTERAHLVTERARLLNLHSRTKHVSSVNEHCVC